jgi:hypothetical protein
MLSQSVNSDTRLQCDGEDKVNPLAKSGDSIAFGPTLLGKAIQEQAVTTLASEPWFVTKMSHSTDLAEFRGNFREGSFRENR